MKTNRILSILLACLVFAGVRMPVASAAGMDSESGWKKTTVSYRIPFFKGLSEMVADALVKRLPDMSINLGLGDLYSDNWINGMLHELGAQLPPAFAKVMSPYRMYVSTENIARDLSDAIKASITAETTWMNIDVAWGASDRDSFLKVFPVAARPFTNLVLRSDIRDKWLSHYIPAFRALGIPEDQMASKERIDDAFAGTNNYETRSDLLLTAVLKPVLLWAERLETDLVDVMLDNLPNLAYREEDVNNLNNTLLGRILLEALGVNIGRGFKAFVEDKLGGELGKMGITMPPIDWDAVAHAGDLDPETQSVVSDVKLMRVLLLRYIQRAADMPENKQGFDDMIGAAVRGALDIELPARMNAFFAALVKGLLKIVS